jgi:general secretion pathway protein D
MKTIINVSTPDFKWMKRVLPGLFAALLLFSVSFAQAENGLPVDGNGNSLIQGANVLNGTNGTNGSNEKYVSIDFNDVDIEVFIKFISELTSRNFVVDRRVKGKVTIISPSKISIDEAYKVFESVLEVNGFAAVKAGEITKIVPSPDVKTKNISTLLRAASDSPDDRIVTQLIPLKYADPEEIKKLLTPLISKNSVLLSYGPTNMLILTDVYSNIRRLMEILNVIDVADIGRQVTVLPVENADAVKLVTLLENIFETRKAPQRGAAGTEKAMTMVADERTNSIILKASEAETMKIRELVILMDRETPKGSERTRVYRLEHAKAEDMATVLQNLGSKAQASAATGANKAKESPIASGKVNITADKATNSLIIMAEKDEYMLIEEIIKQLDIPRPMVFIECLIMEVNVNKDMNMGVEWIAGDNFNGEKGVFASGFSGGAAGGDSGYSSIPNAGAILPPGFSMGILNDPMKVNVGGIAGTITLPSIGAIISAYKKDKDVHILSTPQILTTDNEEATISVGKNVPFKTKSGTDVSAAVSDIFYETFEYKDVGITLKITPQISKDRMVRLTISQEVSRLESSVDFRPTTLKRTVDTTIIVNDKNTVVIGGLIDDSFSNIDYKTPCLGDVPLFGKAFTSSAKANEKTNLYVFLTPHVIQNPREATEIYQYKKEEMDVIKGGKVNLYDENTPRETGKTIP